MQIAGDEGVGVVLADETPPEPPLDAPVFAVTIAQPPVESIKGTVLPELVSSSPLLDSDLRSDS